MIGTKSQQNEIRREQKLSERKSNGTKRKICEHTRQHNETRGACCYTYIENGFRGNTEYTRWAKKVSRKFLSISFQTLTDFDFFYRHILLKICKNK